VRYRSLPLTPERIYAALSPGRPFGDDERLREEQQQDERLREEQQQDERSRETQTARAT
jgi:hypothetical protein